MATFGNWAPPGVLKDHYTASNFVSPRADGRFDRSLGFITQYIRSQEQRLSMDRVKEAAEFPAWRDAVRGKLRELLKMRLDPDCGFRLLETLPRAGHTLFKYEFYPEPYLTVPFWMLVPEEVIRRRLKAPVVICNPGSGAGIASLAGEPDDCINRYPGRNRQAWWYMRCGMIGVAIENPATASNSEPGVEYGQVQLRFLALLAKTGRTYHGFITEQRLMLIDFLKNHPLVDAERIALSGLSLGCGGVLYTMLMSDDVQAAVYNDFVCSQDTRLLAVTEAPTAAIPAASSLPGARDWFDIQPDLTAALAPRKLLLAEGGPWKGHIEKIVRAYELAGHPENLTVRYYPKYAEPAARIHDGDDLREATGLTPQEFLDWSNVDASQHSFHPDIALPWLTECFFGKIEFSPELKRDIACAAAETEVKLG